MKPAFEDIDEFVEDEPARNLAKKKRRRSDLSEADGNQRQLKKQSPRDYRRKRSRGDDWKEWIN